MDMIRVFIADGDEDYRYMIKELLEETEDLRVVGEAASAGLALAKLREVEADVLLTDLILSGGDGMQLISRLRELPERPEVVVNTSFLSGMLAQQCTKLGAAALLQKPCESETVLERIRWACEFRRERGLAENVQPKADEAYLYRRASEILRSLRFSAAYKGYNYLRDALVFAVEYGHINRGSLKMVLADVAHLHGVSSGSVERDIRTAINHQQKNAAHLWEDVLGVKLTENGFANLEIISLLTECLVGRIENRKII